MFDQMHIFYFISIYILFYYYIFLGETFINVVSYVYILFYDYDHHDAQHDRRQTAQRVSSLFVRIHFIIVMIRWTGLAQKSSPATTTVHSTIHCPDQA